MKNNSLNILIVSFALLVVWVSGGVNINSYCCAVCKENGQKMFTTLTCEEVHLQHHCLETECSHVVGAYNSHICSGEGCCSHMHLNAKHCSIHRTHTILLSQEDTSDWDFSIPQIQLFFEFTPNLIALTNAGDFLLNRNIISSPPPPIESGRDILSQNSLLLI